MIYVIQVFLIVIFISYKGRINSLVFSAFFVSMWIFLFSVRGENYGLDIKTYYKIFLDERFYDLDEVGLYFINDVLSFFSKDLIWFSLSYSLILNVLLSLYYRTIANKYWVVSFLFFTCTFVFFQINLNIYRQGLSALVALIGLTLSHKKNHLYAVLILIGIVIHKASYFVALIYFLSFFKINRIMILFAIVVSVVPVYDLISKYLLTYVSDIVPVFSKSLGEYQRVSELDQIKSSGFDHRNLPVIITCCFFYIYRNAFDDRDNTSSWVLVFSLFGAAIFKYNVLIYDRVILFSQLAYPYFFIKVIDYKFGRRIGWGLLSLIMLCVAFFTVYIWGPRNFLGPYELYEGLF